MKKTFIPLLLLLAAFSCTSNDPKQASANIFSQSDNTTEFTTDSISIKKEGLGGDFSATIEMPTSGNPLLVNSINEWISEQLGNSYEGDVNDVKQMLQFYAKLYTTAKDSTHLDTIWGDGKYAELALDRSFEIEKIYETSKLVTFGVNSSFYYHGAAHPNTTYNAQTFRKSDGRRFGWEIICEDYTLADDSTYVPLESKLRAGIAKYFEVANEDDLGDMLSIEKSDFSYNFPRPQSIPYLTKDGLNFVYQQYEIAPYAMGMPAVTIPCEELPLLQAFKQLLK
jgi:hypothetical protein